MTDNSVPFNRVWCKCTKERDGQASISVRAAVGEFFGTVALVVIGSGSAATLGMGSAASFHSIGAAFGLTLAALMYAMSHARAGQFNPVVSIALCICQHVSAAQAFVNIFFQCVGSAVAGFILSACVNVGPLAPNGTIDMTMSLGANHKMTNAVTDGHAFMAEAGGSFFLCMIIIHCICNNGLAGKVGTDAAPLAVGFIYYALHLAIGPITGCGLNPARSTGPAAVANKYIDQLWIFWMAPLAGAVVAGVIGRFVFMVDHETEDREAAEDAAEEAAIEAQKRARKAAEMGTRATGKTGAAAIELVDIEVGVPANLQGIANMIQELRDEVHHLHEAEKELVLDTKGGE